MKRSYKSLFILKTLMAGCAILLAGCEKEEETSFTARNVGVIRVTASSTDITKAVAATTGTLQSSGGFVLDVWTNDSYYYLNTDYSDKDNYGLPTGDLQDDPADYHYINSGGVANVFYSSTPISYTTASRPNTDGTDGSDVTAGWYIHDTKGYEYYNWITGPTSADEHKFYLRFWARYPQDADVIGDLDVDDPAIDADVETFEYDLPDPSTSSPYADATNQEDILFAYAEINQDHTAPKTSPDYPYWPDFPTPTTTTVVSLKFNHALSMINFCVSPDDATFDVSLRIEDITISNVPTGGSCSFYGNGTIAGKDMFVWDTTGSSLGSYSQTYNASFELPSSASGWKISEYGTAGKHVYTCQNAFMLIPHTPKYVSGGTSNAQITIKFFDMDAGATITKTVDLNPDGDVWLPGHYYTYKIKATKVGSNIYPAVYLTAWDDITSAHYIY